MSALDDVSDEYSRFRKIMEKLEKIDNKLDRINKVNDVFNGDKLLDNQDMCMLLRISERTLQRYRQKGKVQYYMIDGKPYYKASELTEILKKRS